MTRSLNALGLVFLIFVLIAGTVYFFLREEPPALFINEFMADNTTCCPDVSSGANEYDDWIEIYNASAIPVNIGGMYFSEDKAKPLGHKIADTNPELTTIPPGGFLLLWADGSPEQGILHLDFRLDQDGEYIGFSDKSGRTIDSHTFAAQTHDTSICRYIDGGNEWMLCLRPTPGAPNR